MTFTQVMHRLTPVLALILIFSCNSRKDVLEEGISRALADHRKEVIDNVVYQLHFDIPERKEEPIEAELQLSFTLSGRSEDLILDFNAPPDNIKSVTDAGGPVDFKVRSQHVVIPARHLKDSNQFTIAFTAGDQALNRKEDFLYTLFVPARASTCFPLFDQPNIKARYRLSLSFPDDWTALANSESGSLFVKNGRRYTEFGETKPISSYLFAFMAGKFDSVTHVVNGRRLTMYHRETDTARVARNVDEIFGWHTRSLEWLEKYTGITYPFEKFDFALIPSFQFGGMEHPGAVFYKASSLFLDESRTVDQELGRARLIAHETAHMWFGDLVTMDWFDDVWLKEVFANFMAAKIVHPNYPDINHNLQFLMSHYPAAYAVDRTKGTHPIQQELANLKDAGSLYGSIIYQKAPVVMRMLEENMGEDAFQKGMQEYLRTFGFSNATWDDLIRILADKTDYKLNLWNEQWVKKKGMPGIYYNLKQEDDAIEKLVIYNFADDGDGPVWWPQSLNVTLGWKDSALQIPIRKEYRSVEVRESVGLPFPEYMFNNSDGKGYGYFNMHSGSRDHYLENIDSVTDEIKRAALWINLNESMIRGRLDPERLLKTIMTSINAEREPLIVSYIIDILHDVFWIYCSDVQRKTYAARLEGVLLNSILNTKNNNLKATYFNGLKQITYTPEGTDLLLSLYSDETTVEGLTFSENDRISLMYELLVRDVEGADNLITRQLSQITNPDRKQRTQFVVRALSASENERDAFFESLKKAENRRNEEWVLDALHYLHHPKRRHTTLKYIRPGLDLLKEIKETGDIFFPKRWLDKTLGNHQSEEALETVKQFLYRHNKYPADLKNKILQSSDHLFRSVAVRNNWNKKRAHEKEKAADE